MVDPKTWGRSAWKFLHCITIGYPSCPTNKDKENFKTFFMNLHLILPCKKCKIHFKENYDKNPLTDDILSSQKKLFMWLVDIRNSINDTLNKPHVSYNNVIKECISSDNKCCITTKITICLALILVILGIILFFRYKKSTNAKLIQ